MAQKKRKPAIQNTTPKAPASAAPDGRLRKLEEQVRQRAYELYEARGREDGRDLDDWLRAEAEITGNKVHTATA